MEAVIIRKNTLTVDEKDVRLVSYLADGYRADAIGKKMKLSRRTVEANIDRLRWKFGATTQPQLVAIFFRQNLIH